MDSSFQVSVACNGGQVTEANSDGRTDGTDRQTAQHTHTNTHGQRDGGSLGHKGISRS